LKKKVLTFCIGTDDDEFISVKSNRSSDEESEEGSDDGTEDGSEDGSKDGLDEKQRIK